ncbi:DUF357 domain-containing protein [Candidatus Woesearchaeota archaeon]|nr:DUF357 domain-containing protein [Candidatus Woesearchaeota archaeon]MCF8013869.1 DUF357 domain-containing protein [Candidatus Woesearchaeota archaeon]
MNINNQITKEKLDKYFDVTGRAIQMIKEKGMDETRIKEAEDFFDMATRYYSDANHFKEKNDYVLAFAALNYAHGWLDAGARIKLFKVNDSTLFTVDDE